ncbi:hypothetical protein DW085_01730 [Clostridium sp. AF50-3]|uniref:hypothetical protein n=1 Tax=Clostridium sp. AF50-3 TaxID=2293021 RepID=UPI000E535A8B|nr:hypothetical protein [Clostridium sp. AF50-3]RHO69733.1 hypothetical protein DW085_01730 [Clostridium sp. AF50-3]
MPESNVLIPGCLVSYLLIAMVRVMYIILGIEFRNGSAAASLTATLIGIIMTIAIIAILESGRFNHAFAKITKGTLHEDALKDNLDYENGTTLRVYLNNEDYYLVGAFCYKEDIGDDRWLVLAAYTKFICDDAGDANVYNGADYEGKAFERIMVRMSDVKHIEIF